MYICISLVIYLRVCACPHDQSDARGTVSGELFLPPGQPAIYIHTYIHTHIYIYTHTYIYIYIHIYMYLYMYISISLCIYLRVCARPHNQGDARGTMRGKLFLPPAEKLFVGVVDFVVVGVVEGAADL